MMLFSVGNERANVSMQRLSTTYAVTPKGRIINSCTVDHWTVFMLIMKTQVSKLTLSRTPEQNRVGWFQSLTCECVKVINGHPKGKLWNLPYGNVYGF
jgi:hypothetical protein